MAKTHTITQQEYEVLRKRYTRNNTPPTDEELIRWRQLELEWESSHPDRIPIRERIAEEVRKYALQYVSHWNIEKWILGKWDQDNRCFHDPMIENAKGLQGLTRAQKDKIIVGMYNALSACPKPPFNLAGFERRYAQSKTAFGRGTSLIRKLSLPVIEFGDGMAYGVGRVNSVRKARKESILPANAASIAVEALKNLPRPEVGSQEEPKVEEVIEEEVIEEEVAPISSSTSNAPANAAASDNAPTEA